MFRNRLPFFDARLLCIPRRQQARLDRFELAIVDNLIYAFERSVQLRVVSQSILGIANKLLPPLPCDTGKLNLPPGDPPPPPAKSPRIRQTRAKRVQRWSRKGEKSCCLVWENAGPMQSTADNGLDIGLPLSAPSFSPAKGSSQVCYLRR